MKKEVVTFHLDLFPSFAKISLVVFAVILLLSGCTQNTNVPSDNTPSDVSVQYHADDGEYTKDIYSNLKKEEESEALEKEKTIITFESAAASDNGILSYMVTAFNQDNDLYHIEMKRFSPDGEAEGERTRLLVELGAGQGPDIMSLDLLAVDQEMIDQGYLVDLAPLMAASGITDEKYFPAYKCLTAGDKVFGLCPSMDVMGRTIDEKVLGGKEVPDIETLVDKLLAYPEKAAFMNSSQKGRHIMNYFLCGSENLWGMIDWDNKKCDFTGELFSKILEVSKRYADDGKKGYDPIMEWTLTYLGLYPGQEALDQRGRVTIDFYFDDGNFPKYNESFVTLVINANTKNLDGAWAFLSYAMSKYGQNYCSLPVHRELYDEKTQQYLKDLEAGTMQMTVNLTEDSLRDLTNIFNTGRYCPKRTEKILNIIFEEADAYFEGDKTKDKVIEIIQNRVQLLLNEN